MAAPTPLDIWKRELSLLLNVGKYREVHLKGMFFSVPRIGETINMRMAATR